MRDAFIKRLSELVALDPRLILVTGDLGFGVFDTFRQEYPDHFINAGVAEQNMTGIATGLALEGRIPFTYSIGNFPTLRCLEQIRNDAAYHRANVKVVAVGGGFSYGALGVSHHATEDLAILRAIPEVTTVCPSSLWEVAEATEALVKHEGTCYLRLDKDYGRDSVTESNPFQLGKIRVLSGGVDCAILVTGGILSEAEAAHHELKMEGISVKLVSVHTLQPLDEEGLLEAVADIPVVVTLEEHVVRGGLGGAIAEVFAERGVNDKVFRRMGLRGGFASGIGSQKFLRRMYGLDAHAIVKEIKALTSL